AATITGSTVPKTAISTVVQNELSSASLLNRGVYFPHGSLLGALKTSPQPWLLNCSAGSSEVTSSPSVGISHSTATAASRMFTGARLRDRRLREATASW